MGNRNCCIGVSDKKEPGSLEDFAKKEDIWKYN